MTPPESAWTPQEHRRRTFMEEVFHPHCPQAPPPPLISPHRSDKAFGCQGEGTPGAGTADCGLRRKASPCGCRPSPGTTRAGCAAEAPKPLGGGNPKPLLPSKGLLAQTRQALRARGPSWEGSELRGATFSGRKETDGCQSSPCRLWRRLGGRRLPRAGPRARQFQGLPTAHPARHLEGADIERWPTGEGTV